MPFAGYTGWIVQLDPVALGASSNRTMLDINNPSTGIMIGGTSSGAGIDWGVSQITEYTAQQGQWGSTVASYVVPNRNVTIPLILGSTSVNPNTALQSLREKVALFQREGGWLLRQRLGAQTLYADVVDAQLTVPDTWGETGDYEPGVQLVLVTLPDWYSDEATLDSVTVTGYYESVLTSSGSTATISGDHPARSRIIVSDTSGNNQLGLLWGVRSRHYDPAATAALVYEGEALTGVNGASVVTGFAGASGGAVMQITSLPAGSWVSFLQTNIASGNQPLTHQGTYRVWARAYSSTGTPELQFLWGVGSLSAPASNAPTTLPGASGFYLMDLGVVRLDAPPVGSNQWFGVVQAYSPNGGDSAAVDVLYFQPLDEAAGQLIYQNVPPVSSIATTMSPSSGADNSGIGTVAWSNPGNVTVLDGNCATVTLGDGQTSHYLEATGYGFSIPTGATVMGIEAQVPKLVEPAGRVFDDAVVLLKAGAVQGQNKAIFGDWAGVELYSYYGGPTDLWGSTWTPSDINNAGFGVALAAESTKGGTAFVDYVSVTVYYTLASGFTVAQDTVVYANEDLEVRWDRIVRSGPSGQPFAPVSQVIGDLARLAPSGLENRPCQVFIKPTRGDFNSLPDAGLDGFTVQVKYRPTWLFRP